jgi:peptidoglycan hydrolase-like protein with peptidoglycan-binding domain
MLKRILLLGLAVIVVFSLNGCSVICKSKELENQGLKNQVTALESQLQAKDEGINSSRDSNLGTSQINEVKQYPNAKQIQLALKNAGYYQGATDGVMGRNTRQAVRSFQKANNLFVDGRVGKKTWAVLKGYLEQKIK